jgi:hypothetical protein
MPVRERTRLFANEQKKLRFQRFSRDMRVLELRGLK